MLLFGRAKCEICVRVKLSVLLRIREHFVIVSHLYNLILSRRQVEQILWVLGVPKRVMFEGNTTKELAKGLYTQEVLVLRWLNVD